MAAFSLTNTAGGTSTCYLPTPSAQLGSAASASWFTLMIGNASCPTTPATTTPWIAIGANVSSNGVVTVNYSVAANVTIASRTGTITIAGLTFTVVPARVTETIAGSVLCAGLEQSS